MADTTFDLGASYDTAMQGVASIDEQLDSLTDAKGAGKRAHVNTLVTAQQENVSQLTSNLTEKLENATPEVVVGFITGLIRSLKTSFDPRITEYVEGWAKVNISDDTVQPTLSSDEIKAIEAQRAEYYKMAKTLRELAVQLQIVDEDEVDARFPMPRKRTGSRGSRGPQVWSLYVYSVNDDPVDDETSLTEIAKANGYEKRKELTDFIASQMGNDWKPGKDFSVTLPNGKVLEGESVNVANVEVNGDEDVTEDEVTDPE